MPEPGDRRRRCRRGSVLDRGRLGLGRPADLASCEGGCRRGRWSVAVSPSPALAWRCTSTGARQGRADPAPGRRLGPTGLPARPEDRPRKGNRAAVGPDARSRRREAAPNRQIRLGFDSLLSSAAPRRASTSPAIPFSVRVGGTSCVLELSPGKPPRPEPLQLLRHRVVRPRRPAPPQNSARPSAPRSPRRQTRDPQRPTPDPLSALSSLRPSTRSLRRRTRR